MAARTCAVRGEENSYDGNVCQLSKEENVGQLRELHLIFARDLVSYLP